MNIRPFGEDDAPVVAALMSAEEERLYGRPGRLTGADILMFQHYFKESWIWEEDGRTVASASYGAQGGVAQIRGVVADKGRGLGAEIVERGQAFARTERATKILAGVPEPDAAARELFESRGSGKCAASTRWRSSSSRSRRSLCSRTGWSWMSCTTTSTRRSTRH